MLHERSDKPSALHSKLLGLEQLPGEPAPDTAALWSRLERRMEPRPAFQRRYLLWAAACLLLVAGTAVLLTYRQQDGVQAQRSAPMVQQPMARSSDTATARPATMQQEVAAHQVQLTRKGNRKQEPARPSLQQPYPEDHPVPVAAAVPSLPEAQAPTTAAPVLPDLALAEKPPVRKLKVVHFNEIGKAVPPVVPAPSASRLVAHTSAPAYPEGRGSITFSRNTSDDIIKINLSPTN